MFWKALCNEAPYSHELNSNSNGSWYPQLEVLTLGHMAASNLMDALADLKS